MTPGPRIDRSYPPSEIRHLGRPGAVDREFASSGVLLGQWSCGIGPRQSKDELIEGRSQVVDAVGRDQGDRIGRRCRGRVDDNQTVARLEVRLLLDQVRVGIDPLGDSECQQVQVLLALSSFSSKPGEPLDPASTSASSAASRSRRMRCFFPIRRPDLSPPPSG